MRGNLGLFKNVNGVIGSTGVCNGVKFVCSSGFSTSSGGDGSGRGRGRGGLGASKFDFVASQSGKDDSGEERGGLGDSGRGRGGLGHSKFGFVASQSGKDDSGEEQRSLGESGPFTGRGHGRGKTLPSTFDAFSVSKQPVQQPGIGRGRGGVSDPGSEAGDGHVFEPKKPVFIAKDQVTGLESVVESVSAVPRQPIGEKDLPSSFLNVITGGAGRGKPERKPVFDGGAKEENRHLRPRQASRSSDVGQEGVDSSERGSRPPKMSREEAVKKAVGLLSQPDNDPREDGGGRGRGRGRGRGDFTKRGDRRQRNYQSEEEYESEDEDKALGVGDDADGEKFSQFLGPARMSELTEAYEVMGDHILPDPVEAEYIEALDTNLKIELEPEYLLGDLEKNPDIDEKPPLSLREVLEKQKQFLVAYEGMENEEEWEDYVKDAMERVPVLEEIVDHYCGPGRVTAKQQQEELERVAKTVPSSAPESLKRFTDRAVLSLQSNPGWGFHRKWQFMDKLVSEASKSYK